MNQREHRGHGGGGQTRAESSVPAPGKQTLVEQLPGAGAHIQRKTTGTPAPAAPEAVAAGSDAPVNAGVQAQVEAATGASLDGARVHTGAGSAAAAQALGARAFTVGRDIHFAAREYQPDSVDGQRLIAHELVHTAQQRNGAGAPQRKGAVSEPGDAAEVEADRIADAAVAGRTAGPIVETSAPIARQPSPGGGFSPSLGTKKTTLTTTLGTYDIEHGLIKKPDTTKSPPFGQYAVKITMKPKATTGGHDIAFIQTWRMREPGGTPVTAPKGADVTATEVARMDTKTGMVLDRADPSGDKTPFFGMFKDGAGALKERSTAHKGKFGGDDVKLEDKPGVNDPDNMEFTATATDMTDGTPLDAIGWGFKFDSAKNLYSEETPAVIKAGSERLAGRDRAYKKWNDNVATTGSGIDKVPMSFDPEAVAEQVHAAMSGTGTDVAKIRTALLAVSDADRRARVAACYQLETGRSLKSDLTKHLAAADLKGLEDWLK